MANEHVKTDQLNASFRGMMQLPLVRQMGLLAGLTASIALGVYVVLWSRSSDDSVLQYQRMIESQLARKVEDILHPIVGPNKVRAQVVATLDHSLVFKRHKPTAIKKLSVAVVVDHKTIRSVKGKLISTAYTQEDLNRFTTLAKEVVGFNAMRGDTVNVINAKFSPVSRASFFDQPWSGAAEKQVLGGLLAVLFLFGVVRPVMIKLASVPTNRQGQGGVANGDGPDEERCMLSDERREPLPVSNKYESNLARAKAMVVKEPKRVAQVVKQWVNEG